MRRIFARLGEDATFTHGSGQPSSVKGIYSAPYAVLPGGLDAGFSSSEPRFAAMSEDLPAVAQGDVITRGTVNWSIVAIEPTDPGGYTVLQLQKAS